MSPSTKLKMDTLGIEPRASRMLSGCDTTTPCARLSLINFIFSTARFRTKEREKKHQHIFACARETISEIACYQHYSFAPKGSADISSTTYKQNFKTTSNACLAAHNGTETTRLRTTQPPIVLSMFLHANKKGCSGN